MTHMYSHTTDHGTFLPHQFTSSHQNECTLSWKHYTMSSYRYFHADTILCCNNFPGSFIHLCKLNFMYKSSLFTLTDGFFTLYYGLFRKNLLSGNFNLFVMLALSTCSLSTRYAPNENTEKRLNHTQILTK